MNFWSVAYEGHSSKGAFLYGAQPCRHHGGLGYHELPERPTVFDPVGVGYANPSYLLLRVGHGWLVHLACHLSSDGEVDDGRRGHRSRHHTQPVERQLLATVRHLVKQADLPKMPEVGIYESEEVNAFATGPTRSRALVAVSSGLLRRMDWTEIEGVLGHEITHIANGDMVTMTLLQGVVNAFVMFFARIVAYAVTTFGRKDNDSRSPFLYNLLVAVFEVFFMILGAIVVAAYSRAREYRADEGGARYAGKAAMIQALTRLQEVSPIKDPRAQQASFQALKISNPRGILWIFATHPPLSARIARLKGEP